MQYHTCNTWTKLTSVFSLLFGADSHFHFWFKKTLHICKSLSQANEGSSGSLTAHSTYLQSRESRKKKEEISPDCEWTDWDRTWGRGWRPSCSWVWAGGAACVGQPAAERGTLLVGPLLPSPRRALTGGLQCNTKSSAVPCFQSTESRGKAQSPGTVQRERQSCCTWL